MRNIEVFHASEEEGYGWGFVYLDGDAEYGELHAKTETAPDLLKSDTPFPNMGVHEVTIRDKGEGLAFIPFCKHKRSDYRAGCCGHGLVVLKTHKGIDKIRERYELERKKYLAYERAEYYKEKYIELKGSWDDDMEKKWNHYYELKKEYSKLFKK